MDVSFLAPAVSTAPVASVTIDTGKHDESAGHEIELRWRALAEQLAGQGAPQPVVDRVATGVDTLVSGRSPAGLVVVADADRVLLRHELLEPPVRDTADFGDLPQLADLLRQGSRSVDHLVVTVDRIGGAIRRYGPDSAEIAEIGEKGEDWPITKVHAGGWSERRFQRSVEGTWDENMSVVAHEVNRLVQATAPALVLVAGDVRARALLVDHLSEAAGALVRVIEHPGDQEPTPEVIWEQVLEVAAEQTTAVLDEVRRAIGQGSDGVGGLAPVAAALQRSQVRTLVVADTFLADDARHLQAGDAPTDLATDAASLVSSDAREVPAARALVRAAVLTDAEIFVAADDALPEPDCAALLRYADASTGH